MDPAFGVYIFQLVRYAKVCSRNYDFIYRHRRLSLKLQQQGYKYQQLIKLFHKFYRSYSDELKKFGTTLMQLRSSIWKEVLVEHTNLNYIFISDVCVIVSVIFFRLFLCHLLRAYFLILLFARVHIIVLYSDVGRKLSINGYNFIFLAYTNVCSVAVLT